MTDREVMQMALDAVQDARDYLDIVNTQAAEAKSRRLTKTLEALRAALAQGEQEPKPQAWMLITESGACGGIFRFRYDAEVQARELGSRFSIVPLYGAPIAASDISAEPVAKSEESRQVPVAWVDVKDYESQYEVSSNGDIRNKKTGTVLSKSLMGAGYVKADLWKDGVRWQTSVHRIVASAFVDNPEMLDEVNHINGNKTDNRAVNLEWVSRADNVNHSYYELGNQVKPVIATHIERGEKFHYPSISAAERDGFSSAHIINVINGKRKQHKGFTFSYADTAPPQHEWQRLTDEEINTIAATPAAIPGSYVHLFARAIEAKLKEKNT